ncbi:MAG: 2-oxo acid dehydrogenase subunit E2 [Ruminococcaceae bacterium]|nr:2-oxo acid dehydrogenase subunit E2 [Oscillospiraceae bacterium]
MEKRKRRRGDRKDGYWVRETDSMHAIMPYMLPNRTDNEAFLTETIDMTKVIEYIDNKNADGPEFKYTFFHFLAAAIAKTIVLRPKMNRFYSGHRLYDRKDILLSFTVKKKFVDSSEEALAIVKIDQDSDVAPIEQVYEQVKKIVYSVRKENKTDGSTEKMDILMKLPRPIMRFVVRILRWLEYHGKYPKSLMKDDPYYSTVFLSNLGSIKMSADYHHLANWGTNSIFAIIGEMKPMPFYGEDGSVTVKKGLTLSMTIDERIADGFYFANSIKILRKLVENPTLIDMPINSPLE